MLLMMKILLSLSPIFLLMACSGDNEPEKGTSVTIDATGDEGEKVSIKADGDTGKVAVNLPGLDANVRLPKVLLEAGDFDIDGVKLYPGSTISSVNVKAEDKGKDKESGDVRVTFLAPDTPAKVSEWYKSQFAAKSISVSGDANRLSGKTKEGDPFSLEFTAKDGGKTEGVFVVTG
jgi:hypothetical protein